MKTLRICFVVVTVFCFLLLGMNQVFISENKELTRSLIELKAADERLKASDQANMDAAAKLLDANERLRKVCR